MRKKMEKKLSYTRAIICKTVKIRFCEQVNPLIYRTRKTSLEIELQRPLYTLQRRAESVIMGYAH